MGTDAWRNWRAALENPLSNPEKHEEALYSDARFIGSKLQLGPYTVLPTMARDVPMPMALIMRCERHTSLMPELVDYRTNELLPADDSGYHGGTVSDEIAALVSLALGVRCRAGGITRVWGLRSDDPAGEPVEFDRQYLSRPGPPGTEILPAMNREVRFEDATETLATFPILQKKAAARLARAARLYSNALWWANEDPNFAWLQLVGAVEAIAAGQKSVSRPPVDVLADFHPNVWEALGDASTGTKEKVAKALAQQVGATRKFVDFVESHAPEAPQPRPEYRVDWSTMRQHMTVVYRHRSRALHDGKPFPHPMLDTPTNGPDGLPSETPVGMSAAAKGGSWMAQDMPMLLHTFEYIVRGSILNWWTRTARKNMTP
ncbi:hypothetical protein [Kocuria flava]|uniref:ApeA N-terminal domain-containing protein n=1 Tax=Kocuria flava TaxID=446860 RepID=A0ABQ0X8I8_9MICC|nr:hypothetical protein [Kocuria flava]GEO92174.1 hypothetical protein KFL01_14800 [Kocuria flava]